MQRKPSQRKKVVVAGHVKLKETENTERSVKTDTVDFKMTPVQSKPRGNVSVDRLTKTAPSPNRGDMGEDENAK